MLAPTEEEKLKEYQGLFESDEEDAHPFAAHIVKPIVEK